MEALIKFFDDISKFWWTILGGGISLTAYLILERFKNRLSYFESSVAFNSVGTSLIDNVFGDIKVTYNGREIKHLNFITIQIKNTSNSDFEKLRLTCWVDNRSQFLVWKGNFDSTLIAVKYEENYAEREGEFLKKLDTFLTENPGTDLPRDLDADLYYHTRNKEFILPVFNRKDSITMNFLVENFDGNVPLIKFPIQHKSVRTVPVVEKEIRDRRLGLAMFINGYIVFALATIWLFRLDFISLNNLIIYVILSALYLWLGLLVHSIKNYIVSLFK